MNKYEIKIQFNADRQHLEKIADTVFQHLVKLMDSVNATNILPTVTIFDGTFDNEESEE